MADLTPELAAEIIAACEAGATNIAAALGAALGGQFEVHTGTPQPYDPTQSTGSAEGAGLVMLLRCGMRGALLVLPESTGLLPDWYTEPDATGRAKLSTLAQELNLLMIPESVGAKEFRAERVSSLQIALGRCGIEAGAQHVVLELVSGELRGELSLIWPVTKPNDVFDPHANASESADPSLASESRQSEALGATPLASKWPTHTRNVLRVKVPLIVTLASQRTPIQEIIELGPGSIVKFEKTCEEPLELAVGDRSIARGEVVKVGDKFGLRIGSFLKLREVDKTDAV